MVISTCSNSSNPYRADFPAVDRVGAPVFFDNAATTQKPLIVIQSMVDLWQTGVTAVDRSNCSLAAEQARQLETSYDEIAHFFGARGEELIITKSATEALDLVARNLLRLLGRHDNTIVLGRTNHSSNLAPWGEQVTWLDFDESGRSDSQQLARYLIDERVRVISLSLTSNVFGTREHLAHLGQLVATANQKRTKRLYLVVDAAASVNETKLNFDRSQVDFLIVSGHKMYGPAVAGVCVKRELITNGDFVPLLVGGGNYHTPLDDYRRRFRAGVTDLVGVVGWAAACRYLSENCEQKLSYLQLLTNYLVEKLSTIPQVELLGLGERGHLVSFTFAGYDYQDVIAYLAANNICARAGNHCAPALYQQLQLPGSIRLSLALYNTREEVDKVVALLAQLPQKIIN